MRFLSSMLLLAGILVAPSAQARLLEPRHEGFFMRFQAGPGYMQTEFQDGSTKGLAGTLGFALGGAITENIILYGEVLTLSASDPDVTYGSRTMSTRGTTLSQTGFGPGLAIYLPGNFYLSGSLLFSRVQIEEDRSRDIWRTDMGLGTRLSLGKEWWVSSDWGLGLALVGDFSSMRDLDNGPRVEASGLSVAFSATFN